jgi:hypothetical protein
MKYQKIKKINSEKAKTAALRWRPAANRRRRLAAAAKSMAKNQSVISNLKAGMKKLAAKMASQ